MKKFDLKKLEGLKEEKFQIPMEEQKLLRGGYNEGVYAPPPNLSGYGGYGTSYRDEQQTIGGNTYTVKVEFDSCKVF